MIRMLIVNQEQFGYHTDTYSYCRYLRDRYTITYLCWDYGEKKISLDGIQIIFVSREGSKGVRLFRLLRAAIREIRSGTYDLIFIVYFAGCGFLRAFVPGKRTIVDIRSGSVREDDRRRHCENRLMLWESCLFGNISVISESLGTLLGLPKWKTTIIPLGGELIEKSQSPLGGFHLLYVGTLDQRDIDKTVDGLDAFLSASGDAPLVTYDIVGSGPPEAIRKLRRAIENAHHGEVVRYHGRIPYTELGSLFRRNNVGVAFIPRKEYYDCQPSTKVFECLLAGMPVLATDTNENRRVITNDNGVVFPDTAEGFCEGLRTLVQRRDSYDPKTIQEQSQKYAWPTIVNSILNPFLQRVQSPMERKKILFIAPMPPPFGGVGQISLDLAESDLSREFAIDVLNFTKRSTLMVRTFTLEWYSFVFAVLVWFRMLGKLLLFRPAIVYLASSYDYSYFRNVLMMLTARLFGRKVICHFHGRKSGPVFENPGQLMLSLLRFSARSFHKIIMLSEGVKESLTPVFGAARIEVLPNFVDVDRFRTGVSKAGDVPRVIFIGRLSTDKGIYELIRAVARIMQEGIPLELDLLGVGETEEEERAIRDLVADLGLTGAVVFHGVVVGERKAELLASARVLVLPSKLEIFPVALLEAYASGLPVIATAVGAVPEIVKDGENGFLFVPGDIEGLVSRLRRLLTDEKLCDALGKNNRSLAEVRYDRKIVARKFSQIVHSLLTDRADISEFKRKDCCNGNQDVHARRDSGILGKESLRGGFCRIEGE